MISLIVSISVQIWRFLCIGTPADATRRYLPVRHGILELVPSFEKRERLSIVQNWFNSETVRASPVGIYIAALPTSLKDQISTSFVK